jgi:5'-nucleotidase
MRVLLTNDDGVHANGLRSLREHLIPVFDSVVTIAPEQDCSGFARKCTYSRPVTVRRLVDGQHPIYSCDGTPTDCVRVGILGGLGLDPNLVVSGINHGANLADDVTYSGTVGAGLEAAVLGTSALCLSQQTPTGSFSVNYREDLASRGLAYDFSFTAPHAAQLALGMVTAAPDLGGQPTVLSVNYPSHPSDQGITFTRPGRRDYPRASTGAWPEGVQERSLFLFGEPDQVIPDAEEPAGTDIAAMRAGRISMTPLSLGLGLGLGLAEPPKYVRSFLLRVSLGLSKGPRNA